jgi:hypothetical protein
MKSQDHAMGNHSRGFLKQETNGNHPDDKEDQMMVWVDSKPS